MALAYGERFNLENWSRTWLVIFLTASGIYVVLARPTSDVVKGNPQT